MRPPVLLLCLALVGVPAGGCALVGDPCATPVTGTARYVSGSTPPPYHHEWSVDLAEASGTVTWSPGYGAPESWTAAFTPDPGAVAQACRQLRRAHDGETPTGGGTLTVRWRSDGGRTTALTTSDPAANDLVRSAVPAAAWSEARDAYLAWQQGQRR